MVLVNIFVVEVGVVAVIQLSEIYNNTDHRRRTGGDYNCGCSAGRGGYVILGGRRSAGVRAGGIVTRG